MGQFVRVFYNKKYLQVIERFNQDERFIEYQVEIGKNLFTETSRLYTIYNQQMVDRSL